jgi:hypothetical protein
MAFLKEKFKNELETVETSHVSTHSNTYINKIHYYITIIILLLRCTTKWTLLKQFNFFEQEQWFEWKAIDGEQKLDACMLGVVADPVALAKYRLWSIDRNDKSRC